MKAFVTFLLFLAFYVVGSRIVFVPAGMALGIGKYVILVIVFFLDLIQIPFYFYIYEKGASKIKFLSAILEKLPKKEDMERSGLLKFAKSLGSFGVVFVAAMPAFGGGMWTAVFISFLLGIERKKSIILLAIGSLIGCLIIVYGFEGILHLLGIHMQTRF